MSVVVLEEEDPYPELTAAIQEWADALKILGDELWAVAEVAPWWEIFLGLIALGASIAYFVLSCIPVPFMYAIAANATEGSAVATQGCCGGASAVELDFDFNPIINLLVVPMVKALTHFTLVLAGLTKEVGPDIVANLPLIIDTISDVATAWC